MQSFLKKKTRATEKVHCDHDLNKIHQNQNWFWQILIKSF